jgi:aryl-alcohol dehydrogenase-like predicted oxidoreductase
MRQRNLGNTGISVSELGLGTWGLSGDGYGKVAIEDQDAVIERALTLGITLFETADCYGKGAMETKLGEKLPKDSVVVTKVGTDRDSKPARKRFDRQFLVDSVARSSERLQRERLDVVLLHNPSVACLERGEAADTMASLVADGKIRAWGVSAGNAEAVNKALAHREPPAVVQLAYNVVFSKDVDAVQPELESRSVGLLARSVLSYGLLGGFWGVSRRFARDDHRLNRWTQDQLERRIRELTTLRAAVTMRITSLRSLAVRFVLQNSAVGCAVLGPRSVLQLDQLVREAGTEPPYLDEAAMQRLQVRVQDAGALE